MDDQENMAMAQEIKNRVSEFLESFVLCGYTADGERISIAVSKTEQQSDALASFLGIICDDIVRSVSVRAPDETEED
ncbi:MAG: hypothetical protein D0530_04945 [Methylococcales bacterium]|nr:MAG: hypothetical protein D0530_04945 [Methylococcales bacterium]